MPRNIAWLKIMTIGFFPFFAAIFLFALASEARAGDYPRLANYYLHNPIPQAEVASLAKFDVLILHMLAQQNSPEQIRQIRRLNPNIIILVYIASEEFPIEAHLTWDPSPNGLFKKQLAGITDDMWLKNENNEHVVFWGSNWMLNVTDYPTANRRWTDYLSSFVVNELLSTGLWDGVFYDNSWYDISWLQSGKIDANRDGRNDNSASLDSAWRDGMSKLFRLTREKAKKNIYIVGNGDKGFYGDINGIYFESFSTAPYISWEEKMRLYKLSANTSRQPSIAIIGNTSADTEKAKTDYAKMRFGLASALMENGYYGYDKGASSHAENWWYDEYSINLGEPTGSATALGGSGSGYYKDVWKREFTNGVAIVNSLAESRSVDLGGEYEKIIGTQDADVNNGGIVSKVDIGAKDGLLMLKTFQIVRNLLFVNGNFVRFVDYLGRRVRNGFFAYDAGHPGGARIYRGDVNGDGLEEKIVATGPKLEIYNSTGGRWYNDYPYGANYKGDIRIAVGKLLNQAQDQILVAPSIGGKVIIYDYHGVTLKASFSPFDPKYNGGLSVAIAHLSGADKPASAIIGVGKGKSAEVLIYDNMLTKLQKRFYAYDKSFKGGIFIAGGDANHDGTDELIVGPVSGKNMPVRIFDGKGKKISEIKSGGLFGTAGTMVGLVDINFDQLLDIALIDL